MNPFDALIAILVVMSIAYLLFRFVTFAVTSFKNALKVINDDDALDDHSLICDDCYTYIADALDTEKSIKFSRDCETCGTKTAISTKD